MSISSEKIILSDPTTNKIRRGEATLVNLWPFKAFYANNYFDEANFSPIPIIETTGDSDFVRKFYHGEFTLAGHTIHNKSASPFLVGKSPLSWQKELHKFAWLQHMFTAKNSLSLAMSRNLINDWTALKIPPSINNNPIWDLEVTAFRLINWLIYSSWLVKNASNEFKLSFAKLIKQHVNYLYKHSLSQQNPNLLATMFIGIKIASRTFHYSEHFDKYIDSVLQQQLKTIILPDGGHISRDPFWLYQLLSWLLPLRQSYIIAHSNPPYYLINTIERLLPALRFFKHRDGRLANFNGIAGASISHIERLLTLDDTHAQLFTQLPQTGYHRLNNNETILIIDTGPYVNKPNSDSGYIKNYLAFEFSAGRQQFIISHGKPHGKAKEENLADLKNSNSNISKSMVQICSQNDARDNKKWWQKHHKSTKNNKLFIKSFTQADCNGIRTMHDLFLKDYGCLHIREITLSADGDKVTGYDSFIGASKQSAIDKTAILRFPLHPNIDIHYRNHGFLLVGANQNCWAFECTSLTAELEEFTYYDDYQETKSKQIILKAPLGSLLPQQTCKIEWSLWQMTDRNLF